MYSHSKNKSYIHRSYKVNQSECSNKSNKSKEPIDHHDDPKNVVEESNGSIQTPHTQSPSTEPDRLPQKNYYVSKIYLRGEVKRILIDILKSPHERDSLIQIINSIQTHTQESPNDNQI